MSEGDRQGSAVRAPSPLLAALEYRAVGERLHTAQLMPLLRRLPKGDGHPVVVFPGFTASDVSTGTLRQLLRSLGYRTYGWGLGQNMGPTPRVVDGLVRRVLHAHDRQHRTVSLIGWSLGGIYAREVARARPDLVRQVITLGSPIQMAEGDRSGAQRIWDAVRRHHAPGFVREGREMDRPRLEVPATSVYSKTDGVVQWKASLIRTTDHSENIRVFGSHVGLGVNASVLFAIADRLAQPEGEWSPFSPPWWLRGVYPPAASLDPSRFADPVRADRARSA